MKPRLLDTGKAQHRFRCRSEGEIRQAKGWLCGFGETAEEAYANWQKRIEGFDEQKRIAAQRFKNLQRFDQWVTDEKLVGVSAFRKLVAAVKAKICGEQR